MVVPDGQPCGDRLRELREEGRRHVVVTFAACAYELVGLDAARRAHGVLNGAAISVGRLGDRSHALLP